MRSTPPNQPGSYHIYVLIILLMVGLLLAWQAWSRTSHFYRFHQQLAVTSVKGAADEIEILLNELRRSMRLFAVDRRALLDLILTEPDDDTHWNELEAAVQEHFPEVFGLTVTDTQGNVLRPDFENRVADICQEDILAFIARGYQEQGHIHPNPLGYHFDVMVPWGDANAPRGVFFLSFQPAMLARVLQRLQSPKHELILVDRNRPGLIEVTAQGARDTLQREFFLAAEERGRVTEALPIAGSRWDVIDLPATNLLRREAVRNWAYAATVFGVFISVTLLMLYQLRRKERFRMLAEEQAIRHQNELAHVDRLNTLGEMASGIAHELNQPLTAISTYCQSGLRILENIEDKPDKLVHILEASSQQAKRAGEIIHRMRQFAAKGKAQRTRINVNRVIGEAAEFIRPRLDRQGIALQLDLAHGLPDVMADSIQLEQVILNLLHNAIESIGATPAHGAHRLVISTLASTDQIEVGVSDTGQGIPPDSFDRLFDTFYSTKTEGMGLGLAISRSIIEAHGGQLWAETRPSGGAVFRFTLPRNGLS
ncbi:MAG: ATP-binding protein [Pseudomonadota bacterium]